MALRLLQTLLLSLSLTGCSLSKKADVKPEVPEAPIEASDKFADKQDAAIERAAGYVHVASEENKKAPESEPKKKVAVLLEAASAFLDKPSEADIQKANALLADPKRIEAIKAEAEKARDSVDAANDIINGL